MKLASDFLSGFLISCHGLTCETWMTGDCVYPSEHPFLQLCGSAVIPVCLTEFLMGIKVILKTVLSECLGKEHFMQ